MVTGVQTCALPILAVEIDMCGEPTRQLEPPSWRVPAVKGFCLFDEPADREHREAGCTISIRPAGEGSDAMRRVSDDRGEFNFGEVPPGEYLLTACSNGSLAHQAFITVDPRATKCDIKLYLKWTILGPPGHPGG